MIITKAILFVAELNVVGGDMNRDNVARMEQGTIAVMLKSIDENENSSNPRKYSM